MGLEFQASSELVLIPKKMYMDARLTKGWMERTKGLNELRD